MDYLRLTQDYDCRFHSQNLHESHLVFGFWFFGFWLRVLVVRLSGQQHVPQGEAEQQSCIIEPVDVKAMAW